MNWCLRRFMGEGPLNKNLIFCNYLNYKKRHLNENYNLVCSIFLNYFIIVIDLIVSNIFSLYEKSTKSFKKLACKNFHINSFSKFKECFIEHLIS